MTTLIGLFADELKAEEAINALTNAGLDDIDFETVSNWANARDAHTVAAPSLNSGYGQGVVPVVNPQLASWNLDEEEETYFRRSVEKGGVLVVVDVDDDDHLPRVRSILEQTGEKVTVSS